MQAKGLWRLLETYPFPEDVRRAGVAAVASLLSKGTGKKRHVREQAEKVYQAAEHSVGLKAIGKADRVRLTMYLDEIKRSDARRILLEREMEELLREIPLVPYLLSLPGMGKVSCAVFLGELGNPKYFQNPRQIIKYAGYCNFFLSVI
jgi:transposase